MSKKELCLSDQKYYCVVLLFSHWFVSSSLQLQGLQHARLPCPSLSLPVCSNSCPFSRWCCLTISFFVSLFSFCLQSFPVSVFSNESDFCIRWPKYWSFSISPSNEYWVLISFRIDWFDLLAVQGTLKSLLEHHSSKASILGRSAFFMVQLLAFLPRSNCLLISYLQSLSVEILKPKRIKPVTASRFSPSICHEVMGQDAKILVFWMLSFKPVFHSLLSPSSRGSLVTFCFLP